MKYAPPEIAEKAKEEMLKKTLRWVAAREEKKIPRGPADYYAKNVVQLLIGQSMKKKSVPGRTRYVFVLTQIGLFCSHLFHLVLQFTLLRRNVTSAF